MENKNSKCSLGGISSFLVGLGLGLIVGVLIAPESGERTRKKLIKQAEKIKDDTFDIISEKTEDTSKKISETAKDVYKKTTDLYNSTIKKVIKKSDIES